MFTPGMLARMAPKGGLLHRMADLMPGAATPSLASVQLFSDPVAVTVDGIGYQMSLSAAAPPAAFDQPPQLAVELDRTKSAGGMIVGEQDHVYGYAPIGGMSVTANAGLTRATVKTGTSISPSAVDLHFHATGPVEGTPCSLVGGGSGVFQIATGKLTAQTFRVATGTSPFFGTITTAPATATLVHDPGCSNVFLSTVRPVFRQQCPGRASLVEGSLTSFWDDELGFGGGRVSQFGVTETNPFGPAGVDHLAAGVGPGADMPRPVHAGGATTAQVLTSGVPFMGGRAVFRSLRKPHISPGHTCSYERHTYHFTTTRYSGSLTAAASPLSMLFDTGAEAVVPARAALYLRSFTR
jgi:hypothetical protein